MAVSPRKTSLMCVETAQCSYSEADTPMATTAAQVKSLESKIRLLLLLGDSQQFTAYTEPQLKELWNGLQSASNDIGKTIKKYKERERVSRFMKTNWKDTLLKPTPASTEPFNSVEARCARKLGNMRPFSEYISDERTEAVVLKQDHQGEVPSNKQQTLPVDENRLVRKEVLLLEDNFSDELVINEECQNSEQKTLSQPRKNLVQAAPVTTTGTGDARQGSEYARRSSEGVAKKQLEAETSNAWFLKEYSALKETAMANGWASYQMGNVRLGGHSIAVGVHLKKRGCLVNMHINVEMQSGDEPTSWPVKKGIKLRLVHPKNTNYCTLEANGEGSVVLCQSGPEAPSGTYKYISKKYFALRDIKDGGYVKHDTLKFLVEVT